MSHSAIRSWSLRTTVLKKEIAPATNFSASRETKFRTSRHGKHRGATRAHSQNGQVSLYSQPCAKVPASAVDVVGSPLEFDQHTSGIPRSATQSLNWKSRRAEAEFCLSTPRRSATLAALTVSRQIGLVHAGAEFLLLWPRLRDCGKLRARLAQHSRD